MKLKEYSTCPLCGIELCISFEAARDGQPIDSPRECHCGRRDARGRGLAGTIRERWYRDSTGQWNEY
jgi:hypothetical protein